MRPILIFIVVVVVAVSCNTKTENNTPPETPAGVAVKLVPVTGDTSLNGIRTSGFLSTEEELRLSFKTGGVIDQIRVEEGQSVKKGQLLATLKSTEIEAMVNQAQLAVEKAQRDFQRAQNLYRDSVATLEQYQNARTQLDIARQSLQQAVFNQQYSKIVATTDGFIAKKVLHAGELASPGTPVLIVGAVSPHSKWVLNIGISDREWAAIEKGNKATVMVDAFPGVVFQAVVSKKSLTADPVSGSFQAELQVDFENRQPAIGMFGNAIITPSKPTLGFSIPYEALLEADGKKGFVFVTDDEKKVQRIEVTIASMDDRSVYIESGLQGHRYVVTSGSPYLSDGAPITVIR